MDENDDNANAKPIVGTELAGFYQSIAWLDFREENLFEITRTATCHGNIINTICTFVNAWGKNEFSKWEMTTHREAGLMLWTKNFTH